MFINKGNYFSFIFFVLVVFSPLLSQSNLGGSGLALTFNISVWVAALTFIATTFFNKSIVFKIPKEWLWFSVFPVFVLLGNLWANPESSSGLLFSSLFILGGLLFILRLFQIELKNVDSWVFIIVLSVGVQAGISVLQIWVPTSLISEFFHSSNDSVPRGIFQQVNVNASFLATGITAIVYLVSRPWFKSANFLTKTVLFGTYGLAVYVVFASGSRVGLLALMLAGPLLLFSRSKQLKQQKLATTILVLLIFPAFFLGQSGLERTVDKSIQLKEQSYSNARVAMYTIGTELVVKQPMGYGMGNFLKAWNPQAADFVKRHPETSMPAYITHPHNEFLMWMIEGGIPALIGLLMVFLGIGIGLWQCGWQRGGAYAAMLIPISLHTQVELPFYLSSLHWFVWLFLVFVVLRHNTISIDLNLSAAARKAAKLASVMFALVGALFLVNTAYAQKDIYNFVHGIKTDVPPLSIALNNLYTKGYAERLAMRSMLYHSIENNNAEKVSQFESWALDYVKSSPELKMYEDLISASLFLRPNGKGCDAIDAGYQMYAHNKPLQEARFKCIAEGLL
jgi:O-antigen polymerase